MPQPYLVITTDFINDSFEIEKQVLGDLAQVSGLGATDEDQLVGKVEEADALIVYHLISITEKTLERLRHCKLIVRGGVGYDNIDHIGARKRGIAVANIPDYGTEEVADTAIGMMLSLTRGIHLYNSRLRDRKGPWSYTQSVPLRRLRGRTLGIVGLGRIGTAVALRAKALGMEVIYYDPYKPPGYDKSLGIRRMENLEDLLSVAYVVTLHCPLTEETHHLINRRTLERMPMESYLINTARGGVVDVSAIVDALQSGRLAGAAIDVLEEEPPPEGSPLLRAWMNPDHPAHDRLILNPHAAFYCEEGAEEIRRKAAKAIRNALMGKPVPNVVNEALSAHS